MTTHEIPTVYKLCDRRYNLALGGKSVRLGKLSYYRSFQHSEIGDIEEGVKLNLGCINGQKMPIYHYASNTSLIFSTTTHVDGKIGDYDSCYKITDPVLFSHLIADCIFDELTLDNIYFSSSHNRKAFTLKDLSMLDIKIQRRIVEYFSPEAIPPVSYDFNRIKIAEHLFDMRVIPFWKNLNYLEQKEFRLSFDVCYQEENGKEWYAEISMPYIDIDVTKHLNALPVELVY